MKKQGDRVSATVSYNNANEKCMTAFFTCLGNATLQQVMPRARSVAAQFLKVEKYKILAFERVPADTKTTEAEYGFPLVTFGFKKGPAILDLFYDKGGNKSADIESLQAGEVKVPILYYNSSINDRVRLLRESFNNAANVDILQKSAFRIMRRYISNLDKASFDALLDPFQFWKQILPEEYPNVSVNNILFVMEEEKEEEEENEEENKEKKAPPRAALLPKPDAGKTIRDCNLHPLLKDIEELNEKEEEKKKQRREKKKAYKKRKKQQKSAAASKPDEQTNDGLDSTLTLTLSAAPDGDDENAELPSSEVSENSEALENSEASSSLRVLTTLKPFEPIQHAEDRFEEDYPLLAIRQHRQVAEDFKLRELSLVVASQGPNANFSASRLLFITSFHLTPTPLTEHSLYLHSRLRNLSSLESRLPSSILKSGSNQILDNNFNAKSQEKIAKNSTMATQVSARVPAGSNMHPRSSANSDDPFMALWTRMEALETSNNELRLINAELRLTNAKRETRIMSLETEVSELKQSYTELKQSYTELKQSYTELKQSHAQLKQEIAAVRSTKLANVDLVKRTVESKRLLVLRGLVQRFLSVVCNELAKEISRCPLPKEFANKKWITLGMYVEYLKSYRKEPSFCTKFQEKAQMELKELLAFIKANEEQWNKSAHDFSLASYLFALQQETNPTYRQLYDALAVLKQFPEYNAAVSQNEEELQRLTADFVYSEPTESDGNNTNAPLVTNAAIQSNAATGQALGPNVPGSRCPRCNFPLGSLNPNV